MQVAITGSSGFIGGSLQKALEMSGHGVLRIIRWGPDASDTMRWDPKAGAIDKEGLEGIDAIVHLAGESIGGGRWTESKKGYILDSRVLGTRLISTTAASLQRPPSVLVSGSAIGFYGNRQDEVLTEESPSGEGFFAGVVRQWEAAAEPAEEAGIRVPRIRSGIVLSPRGGALKRMLLPFKLGLGGRLGSGRQYWSWISLQDHLSAVLHLLETPRLGGPVNLTAPHPVTQEEFAKTLARVLGRPALLPTPTFGLRALWGSDMVEETLTGGQRVIPQKLQGDAFAFLHPELEGALRAVLAEAA
jgi:uncharacterized protein (TIGR01777 family)